MSKRKNNQPGKSPLPPTTINVITPVSRFDRFKACLDSLTTIILFLTLVLTFWQFKVAMKKEDEASTALRLAQEAQTISRNGLDIVESAKAQLEDLEKRHNQSAELTEIAYLTVRAENGDRAAFERLVQHSEEERTPDDPFIITVAEKNISRILKTFSGDTSTDPWIEREIGMPPLFGHGDVETNLDNPRFAGRAWAVHAVETLRLNNLIPHLIEIGFTDPDLHVVHIVCNTLNNMLTPVGLKRRLSVFDFVISPDRTREELQSFWESRKDALLAVKPKYWKKVDGDNSMGFMQLTDPEGEQGGAGYPPQGAGSPDP